MILPVLVVVPPANGQLIRPVRVVVPPANGQLICPVPAAVPPANGQLIRPVPAAVPQANGWRDLIDNDVDEGRRMGDEIDNAFEPNEAEIVQNEMPRVGPVESYIRPILTYAYPVFSNSAKTHILKLQRA